MADTLRRALPDQVVCSSAEHRTRDRGRRGLRAETELTAAPCAQITLK